MSIPLFLAIGFTAGVLAGLFGIGGGILIVPALAFFAKMPIKQATGTSLGALLLPVGILGVWKYWQAGNIEIRASLWIAAGLTVGALVGATLVQRLEGATLQRAFAAFLVAVAARMWLRAGG
ncbi:MAG: TSUP family transporter [Gemmatimonadales bacterium]|nr:TSUP family transporter [Gemmatimonadales bacterium]